MDKSIKWDDFVVEELKYDEKLREGYIKNSIHEFKYDKDIKKLLIAVKRIMKAQYGLTKIARKLGTTQQALQTFFKNENPKIKTLMNLLEEIGLTIEIKYIKK